MGCRAGRRLKDQLRQPDPMNNKEHAGHTAMERYRNCVTPEGVFTYGIHKPSYTVKNLRQQTTPGHLGRCSDGTPIGNRLNYPEGDVEVGAANWIFEIANPLPFRGATFIDKSWADARATEPSKIHLAERPSLSFDSFLRGRDMDTSLTTDLPRPLLLTLATCSTDAADLIRLAELCCQFVFTEDGEAAGLFYSRTPDGHCRAVIHDHDLFEAVANNPALPDSYKQAMVLRPGAQGASEIVGEWRSDKESHIYEYLRRNSYIAGGHFAANMAEDAVRYSITSLSGTDMDGLRHLYYQRMYIRLAQMQAIDLGDRRFSNEEDLEQLRRALLEKIDSTNLANPATLWGWNFGFDYSPTDYRLHASHQQIHQQYAIIPDMVEGYSGTPDTPATSLPAFSCGDMVTTAIDEYRRHTGSSLFHDYAKAIGANTRLDGRHDLPASLVVWEDENIGISVPKAQTSQWELQIMTKADKNGLFAGNILETNSACRLSLNKAILTSQQVLASLGAKMVTSIEYSKRLGDRHRFDQPLLYSLLPKLPYSMGAFSEAQLRFINSHYPEDFAAVCRKQL